MPKWREIAKVLNVDLEWLLADEEETLDDDEQWLMSVTQNPNLAFGLKELLEDVELVKGLKIDGLEWSVLETLNPALKLTKNGYVAVLYALRNGCARDQE